MEPSFLLRNFSKPFKSFLFAFIVVLSIGYFTGLLFVAQTDSTSPKGMVENYNGNEEVEEATVLKFKKESAKCSPSYIPTSYQLVLFSLF